MVRPFAAVVVAALLSTGCLDVGPATTTLDFDLTVSPLNENWEPGAADYPAGRENDVNAIGDLRPLPAGVGTANALYQAGTNVTGTLFVFQRKYWSGLRPLTQYQAELQVQFVSNQHSGCSAGLATDVVIKAGVTSVEPRVDLDAQNVYRFSLDKGTTVDGGDFLLLDDIRNGLTGCPATGTFAVNNTPTLRQPTQLTTDDLGGFWMFIGTESSVLARHEIYLTRVGLRIR